MQLTIRYGSEKVESKMDRGGLCGIPYESKRSHERGFPSQGGLLGIDILAGTRTLLFFQTEVSLDP